MALSIIGIGYSLYSLYGHFKAYRVSAEKYEQLQYIHESTEFSGKYRRLKELNEDYVGWLTVEGTSIEYPVVQGQDNEFYLTHNFYKESDHVGAIFMDYRNSVEVLDIHTIIYGHNMKDKSMFARLSDILKEDFSEENIIRFETQHEIYEWEIFSAYVTREADWMEINFDTKEEYDRFLNQLRKKSAKTFSTEVYAEDQIITLATCTSRISDERVVVHARLVEKES